MVHKYSATIKINGLILETKPFYAKNKTEAYKLAEKKARIQFKNEVAVDCVNVEEVD